MHLPANTKAISRCFLALAALSMFGAGLFAQDVENRSLSDQLGEVGEKVEVLVVDGSGNPLAEGTQVAVLLEESSGAGGTQRSYRADEKLRSGGRIPIPGLERKRYSVVIGHPEYEPAKVDFLVPADGVKAVLRKRGWIEGRILDDDGKALADATVLASIYGPGSVGEMGKYSEFVFLPEPQQAIETDSLGRFSLKGLGSGKYVFFFQAEGRSGSAQGVEVRAEKGTVIADITLSPVGAVQLTIRKGIYPVAGTEVIVWGDLMNARGGGEHMLIWQLNTDDVGRVLVDNVVPGTWSLSLHVREIIKQLPSISVAAGETATYEVVISGIDVRGTVLDENGKPVEKASVATDPDERTCKLHTVGSVYQNSFTSTDAQGSFMLEGIDAGRYAISASKEGYITAKSEEMELSESLQPAEIRLVLRRAPRRPPRIALKVLKPDGTPLVNAGIELNLERKLKDGGKSQALSRAKTDSAGGVSIGIGSAELGEMEVTVKAANFAAVRQKLVATEQEQAPFEFVLGLGAEVSGILLDSRGNPLAGVVVDLVEEREDPLKEELLRKWRERFGDLRPEDMRNEQVEQLREAHGGGFDGRFLPPSPYRTETSSDGTFKIEHVAPGEFTAVARKEGYREGRSRPFSVYEGGTVPCPGLVLIERQLKSSVLKLRLVHASGGAPVCEEGFLAYLHSKADASRFSAQVQFVTDSNGLGSIKATLPLGTATVSLLGEELASEPSEVILTEEGKENVWEIRMSPASTVSGTVTNPDGQAVEGARLALFRENRVSGSARNTDTSGHFESAALMPGECWVAAYKKGFAPGTVEGVTLKLGQHAAGLDLRLKWPAKISGRAVDAQGLPMAGAGVSVRRMDALDAALQSFGINRCKSDSNGRFSIEDLPAGTCVVNVSVSSKAPALAEVLLSEGQALELPDLVVEAK